MTSQLIMSTELRSRLLQHRLEGGVHEVIDRAAVPGDFEPDRRALPGIHQEARHLAGVVAGVNLAPGLRLAKNLFDSATPGFKYQPERLAHLGVILRHFGREKPKHAAAFEAVRE